MVVLFSPNSCAVMLVGGLDGLGCHGFDQLSVAHHVEYHKADARQPDHQGKDIDGFGSIGGLLCSGDVSPC